MIANPFEDFHQRLAAIERTLAIIVGFLQVDQEKDEYLNTKEAARFLKMSPSSLYRLTMDDKVPVKRVNGRLFFQRSLLEEFINRNGKNHNHKK
jgi:predicted DNA-binding transcriptional regulator AlpA